jgi:hypothetical protein
MEVIGSVSSVIAAVKLPAKLRVQLTIEIGTRHFRLFGAAVGWRHYHTRQ